MKTFAFLMSSALCVLTLSACSEKKIEAPNERNTCFHIGYPTSGGIKFNPIKKNVQSVEYCAAEIEKLRMQMNQSGTGYVDSIDGVYNGNFIFIEGRIVRMGQSYEGFKVTMLVRTDDGRLVPPGAIAVERQTPENSGAGGLPPESKDQGVMINQDPSKN